MTKRIHGYIAIDITEEGKEAWMYSNVPDWDNQTQRWIGNPLFPVSLDEIPEELQRMTPATPPVFCGMSIEITELNVRLKSKL